MITRKEESKSNHYKLVRLSFSLTLAYINFDVFFSFLDQNLKVYKKKRLRCSIYKLYLWLNFFARGEVCSLYFEHGCHTSLEWICFLPHYVTLSLQEQLMKELLLLGSPNPFTMSSGHGELFDRLFALILSVIRLATITLTRVTPKHHRFAKSQLSCNII